jgi:cytochrome c oxidase cbb3-type subunit 4
VDSGTFYGLLTLILMLLFTGIVAWAWSARRRETYDAAARAPLEDEHTPASGEEHFRT